MFRAAFARPVHALSISRRFMSTQPHALFVAVSVKPEQRASFLQVMNDDAKGSRVEPGCIRFDVLEDGEDRNKFYVYSLWRDDKEAIAFHQKQLHYKAWLEFKNQGGVDSWSMEAKAVGIDVTK